MLFKDLLCNRITKRIPQPMQKVPSRFKIYFTSNSVVALRKASKNKRQEAQQLENFCNLHPENERFREYHNWKQSA